jgi:hypothetical protein
MNNRSLAQKKRFSNPEELIKISGKNHWNFGKHSSFKTRRKMSLKKKGKNHPNWKGGLPKCLQCKKEVSSYKTKLCRKCSNQGKNNPNWDNGKTKIWFRIRNSNKYIEWRTKVFERDNYTCQHCGQIGGQLEAHHKKEFAIILKEFLKKYLNLNPIKDIETLLYLAMCYPDFWDVNNGITYCKKYHKKLDKTRPKKHGKKF